MDDAKKPFAEIATRLKWHRQIAGMNQDDYARAIGLKRSQLANFENGDFRLSLDGAIALKRRFGLSLDFLFLGDTEGLPEALRTTWQDRAAKNAGAQR